MGCGAVGELGLWGCGAWSMLIVYSSREDTDTEIRTAAGSSSGRRPGILILILILILTSTYYQPLAICRRAVAPDTRPGARSQEQRM